jgi:glutamyl-tRNA synthetase
MHVGNARTAIFNWLFARHHNGEFVLRIEDTDVERSTLENEKQLLNDLNWLGLNWDEGPYRQSERLEIYKKYAGQLTNDKKAFYCFCTDKELEAKRLRAQEEKRDFLYDGTCRDLSATQVQEKLDAGLSHTIRFKVEPQDIIVPDLIKGEVNIRKGMFGDFVIIRSSGMPVYNFAAAVDDALMEITHIIRAEEHLSNTARQILIYQALGFPVPRFAHTALILAPDGAKLSKRHGATSVREYREKGYLREALLNYLSILGWSPPEEGKDKLSVEELIELFDLTRVSKSSGKFDLDKLNWLNSEYIKEQDIDKKKQLLLPYLKEAYDLSVFSEEEIDKIVELGSNGLDYLRQIQEKVAFFFTKPESVPREWQQEPYLTLIKRFSEEVEKGDLLDEEFFKDTVKKLGKELNLKGKNLFMPIRVFVTGQEHGPDLNGILAILGRKRIQDRLSQWV